MKNTPAIAANIALATNALSLYRAVLMPMVLAAVSTRAAEEIKVGAILAVTGPAANLGGPESKTAEMLVEEVNANLRKELQERLGKAGVVVEEARLTHLAYAPEIASVMLRRQQAEAVIAARQKIVHGAVSMVEMALKELAERSVIQLDEERKAAMVSNLLVVLCSESEVHPVVNAGTLYH